MEERIIRKMGLWLSRVDLSSDQKLRDGLPVPSLIGYEVFERMAYYRISVSIVVFLVGTLYYRHKATSGSPLTSIARVLVAARKKRKEAVPNYPKELYEVSLTQYTSSGKFRIDHIPSLRWGLH